MNEQSQLLAGAAVEDITPPFEVGLLTSSVKGLYEPFASLRLPLKARVLVLKRAADTVAIVSLDLLALSDTSVGGWEEFKRSLSGVLPAGNIVLTCTHTHTAPESVALTGLYLTPAYSEWLLSVKEKLRSAISTAAGSLHPCHVSYNCAELDGFSLQRRIRTPNGIVMSDSVQPIAPELMDKQPVDRRVRTVRFVNASGKCIATVVHAICHPVHEMCLPHISGDFPGEMCRALEASGENGVPVFLNGAAGDTNPPTVSGGAACAREHGEALAAKAEHRQGDTRINTRVFAFVRREMQLFPRAEANIENKLDALARFSAIRLGELVIVFLPGEPFVETALAIEKRSPFRNTLIAGFSENTIGYIPTAEAYEEGGYETGPGKWSFLPKGTDRQVGEIAFELLDELHAAGENDF